MKVMTIGSDRKLFEEGSQVLSRARKYTNAVEEMHIVVFTKRSDGHQAIHEGNLHIYPTRSWSRLLFVLDGYRLGKKIIRQNSFTAGQTTLTSQDPFESGMVGVALSAWSGFPLQLQVHTDVYSKNFTQTFLNRVRLWIARLTIPRAKNIRVVSSLIKKSVCSVFPNVSSRIQILPIFVDTERTEHVPVTVDLQKEYPQFNFILFMASRLTREKEIHIALHALAEIVKKFPRTGLVIAGSGPETQPLKDLAQRLGIYNNVVFIGWQTELSTYFKTANAFLLTSAYEGYAMTLIEAGSAGCPIITTPVGISADICRDEYNSFVCPVGDSHAFAEAVESLITDNSRRELFKQRMRDTIKGIAISESEYVERYVGLLQGMLDGK